ncbi:MAG: RNA polymerase sigma factor [Symbiobacteriia bacterium]
MNGVGMAAAADDNIIIERCQSGDLEAFATLYQREAPRALQTAYFITGNWADAEDSLQEAAVRAWRTIGRFIPGKPFRPWFLKFVTNEALRLRGRRPVTLLPEEDILPAAADEGPEASAERDDRHRLVLEALGTLDLNHRAPAVLFYYEGLSEAEVAEVLGIRQATVKSRLHTARQRLAAYLGQRGLRSR